MRKRIFAAAVLLAATAAFTAFATNAWAFPTQTSPCVGCHSGPNVPVTATLASSSGTSFTYNVSAPSATAIAVFDGSTKLTTITGTSGSFTVTAGKTYTIYAVEGPTTSTGIGSTSVSPVAPPADTTAPVTTSDAKATYVSSATIKLTATDNVGVTATYYTVDGGAQTAGTTIVVTAAGSHTIQFWSVDAAGNVEAKKSATFTITVPDTTAPVTTSDAKATYVSSATIKLTATDNVGVTATYYTVDGGAQTAGTTIVVTAAGSHTIQFWSVDAAGNVEAKKSATFTITIPDTTAPVTTSDAKATYVSSATIKLTATDNVGVTATYYTIDGGAQTAGTTIVVSTAGSHTILFWSVDAAGNVEVAHSATFTITVPDTTAPITTSDAKATYVSSATIKLTATDNVGVAHTYYVLDGAAQVEGTSVTVTAIGSHTLSFWSVDAAGNIEVAKVVSFTVTAPAPVDTVAPVTTSDAKATYVSSATIKLSATDNVGVAHTYYVLDGAAQVEGTTIGVSTVGTHTVQFWSVDAAGNIEAANTVTFAVTAPAPAPAVSLTIAASVHRSHTGRTARLSGLVAPATASGQLALYVQLPGSTRWVLVGHPVVSASGSWSYSYTMRSRGTYHFQVRFVTAAGTIVSRTISSASPTASSLDD